jgi:hypothetical protein
MQINTYQIITNRTRISLLKSYRIKLTKKSN